jgi:hypothetical protein
MATQRGVLHTKKPGEAGGGDGEPFSIPEVKGEFFEGEADDIAIGEGERVITSIVWPNPYQRFRPVVLLDANRARLHRRQLVAAPEEDGEAVPRRARGEAHGRVAQALVQDAPKPRDRVVARRLDGDQARESMRVADRRAVDVDAGGATVDDRLHPAALGGTQPGEEFATLASMSREAAKPADRWVTTAGCPVRVA